LTLRDSLIAALVPIFLGFGFVIAKPAMEYLPPFLLMGLRFTFVALLLVWWFPIPRGYLKKIFFASLIANTIQYSITYTGLDLIDASAAVLLVQTEVPFGVLFAYFMLKEKPTVKALIGIAIAFVGVYILTGSPNLDDLDLNPLFVQADTGNNPRYCEDQEINSVPDTLDQQIWPEIEQALDNSEKIEKEYQIKNTHRAVGTRITHHL